MIFDTNVLIRLERETRRRIEGTASAFVLGLPETRMCITPTIAGEFCSGISMSDRSVWEGFCAAYEMLPITSETSWVYGEIYRHLASKGQLIGTNDLWIAATGLTHDLPIATGNVDEFRRVPDLDVVEV
jgi:tRNA(fMet)-specific endonuclease VapC